MQLNYTFLKNVTTLTNPPHKAWSSGTTLLYNYVVLTSFSTLGNLEFPLHSEKYFF